MSAYEFLLQFGKTDPANPKALKQAVTLRMSPQHAKSVLLLLGRFVSLYEDQIAPITLPEELTKHLNTGDVSSDEPN